MTMQEMGLPLYETVAGHRLAAGTMDHEDVQFCVQCTTEEEVRAYAVTLEREGFAQYDAREIRSTILY